MEALQQPQHQTRQFADTMRGTDQLQKLITLDRGQLGEATQRWQLKRRRQILNESTKWEEE